VRFAFASAGHFSAVMLLSCALISAALGTTPKRSSDEQAQRKKENDQLGQRLIREAAGGEEDLMGTVVRLMDESAHHLEIDFDAGSETQTIQRRIVDRLNEAIKTAGRRRATRSSGQRSRGDRRRMPKRPVDPGPTGEASAAAASAQPNSGTVDAGGRAGTPSAAGGALKETRRAWGHLPERERDELIQGSEENFLEQYRAWIELYYMALQEAE